MTSDHTATTAELRTAADRIVVAAMQTILDCGVSYEMMIDRMLTGVSAQIASTEGAEHLACVLREMAANVDKGMLVAVERRTTVN